MNRLAWAAAPFLPALPTIYLPFDPSDFARHGPRDYQSDILWQIVDAIEAGHRRILVQLPTGGGKTVLATALLASATSAAFMVHRDELIDQTSKTFWRAKIQHSFIAAGRPYDADAALFLAGIATLAKRLDAMDAPAVIVVDEAHHAVSQSWSDVIAAYPDAIVIGLTATPQRLDGRGLDAQFDHLILGPPVRWLIDEGYLSDFDYYAPPLGCDEAVLTGDVLDHYQRLAGGGQGIVFASSREHSRTIVAGFQEAGIRSLHVDGTLSAAARVEADRLFRSGEVRLESNVGLFGEGYDIPNITYCAIARRTQSLSWFLQMCGRALRPVYRSGFDLSQRSSRLAAIAAGPKPRAVLCDHGNNWFSHGMPDDNRAWSLEGKLRGGAGTGCNDDAEPIHQCMTCYRITFSVTKVCPGCGTPFPAVTRNIRFKEGHLTKIERDAIRQQKEEARQQAAMLRRAEEQSCRSEATLIELARKRGYPNPTGWARVRLKARAAGKRKG